MSMPAISGPSMTCSGRPPSALICCHAASGVLDDEVGDAVHECMAQPLGHRLRLLGGAAPGEAGRVVAGRALGALGDLDQALAGVLPAVEDHVLDPLAQLRIEVVVDADHPGVDDAHVHARLDRVVQEHGVDGFAHRVVAAEREADVGDAARDLGAGQVGLDPARRLDELDRVVVVLLDAGGDREDVRVEDDVLGRKAHLVDEDPVGALADRGLPGEGVGLTLLVEGHHHRGGAVAAHQPGLMAEGRLAFLHRDRVDDALALDALQPGLDHLPLRAVDHDRHARDLGLAGDQIQEADHRRLRIEHRLVHVDVDDLGAALDLLAGDAEGLLELAVEDQAGERLRAGDVGALADVDEQRPGADQHRFQAGEFQRRHDHSLRSTHAASSSSSPNSAPRWPQRGRYLPTRSAIRAMCSGVVPQQPPAMLRKPARANSSSSPEVISGVSSKPVSLIGLGRPAFG
jgi:hypothetical protein